MPYLDLSQTLVAFRDFLIARIAASPDTFADAGGADCVLLSDEPDAPAQAGRPYIVLSGTDEPAPAWGHTARKATLSASCKASEFAGGRTGVANPVGSQTRLSTLLQDAVREGYAELRDGGLLDAQIKVGQSGKTEGDAVMFIEHAVSFVYFPNMGEED